MTHPRISCLLALWTLYSKSSTASQGKLAQLLASRFISDNYESMLNTFREVIWSHKFKDSILDIVGTSSGKIIVGLANGNISMFEVSWAALCHIYLSDWGCTLHSSHSQHVSKMSLDDDPAQLHIGSGSVNALVVSTDDIVWCGAGKTIMVVSTEWVNYN